MYKYKDLRVVHLEITSRCNASCPQCSRNISGGPVNPYLPLIELTLSDIKKIFPPPFIAQLELMYMCGVYGDPMTAKDTLQAFNYFRSQNANMRLVMETNGSGKNANWWRALAGIVDSCVFGIDGMEDTNHIYRRGTEWSKIMGSARAFIEAGGKADWAYIVFKHNEHQVKEARQLSENLGFRKFIVKKTSRFLNNGIRANRAPVINREGEFQYFIEMPTGPEYQNDGFVQISSVVKSKEDYNNYLTNTRIACKAAKSKKVYVSSEGLVLPCCWMGKLYRPDDPDRKGEMWKLLDLLPAGKDSINAKTMPLSEIVEGPFFQSLVPSGWRQGATASERLKVCASMCGDIDLTKLQ